MKIWHGLKSQWNFFFKTLAFNKFNFFLRAEIWTFHLLSLLRFLDAGEEYTNDSSKCTCSHPLWNESNYLLFFRGYMISIDLALTIRNNNHFKYCAILNFRQFSTYLDYDKNKWLLDYYDELNFLNFREVLIIVFKRMVYILFPLNQPFYVMLKQSKFKFVLFWWYYIYL